MGWTLVFLAVWGLLWWRGATVMKEKGRGWFMRNWIAGTMGGIFAMVLFGVGIATGLIGDAPKEAAAVAEPVASGYSITSDVYKRSIKRTVEVALTARISETELTVIANAIKAAASQETERTFIGYRVDGKTTGTYWATTHYDPALKVTIQGMPLEDYKTLQAFDVDKVYPHAVGAWLRDDGFHYLMIAYEKGGKHFIDSVFASGEKNTEEMLAKRLPDGGLRLEEPDNGFGEYYVVDTSGNLQGWSENGQYMTLPPRAAAPASVVTHKTKLVQ